MYGKVSTSVLDLVAMQECMSYLEFKIFNDIQQ